MCLGVPGRIVELKGGTPCFGVVAFASIEREVCLAYVPEATVGDFVIVHVGFAISVVDAEEAERTLSLLGQLEVSETDAANTAEASRVVRTGS